MKIHCFHTLSSCLDKVFQLFMQGRLEEWDSVQALSQTEGRGRMRRHWESLPGNIFAATRLPTGAPFDSTASSVACGALFCHALGSLGWKTFLKWPNDLVLIEKGKPGKVGGILLEEREGALFAGIGINLAQAPETMRAGAAIPAACLDPSGKTSPLDIWRHLVKNVLSVYKSAPFDRRWRALAQELLLWNGRPVEISDGQRKVRGILRGLGENGEAILDSGGCLCPCLFGGMRALS